MNPALDPGLDLTPAPRDAEGMLSWYRALASASEQMLEAARQGDWDAVCRIEGASTVLVAQLRRMRSARALPASEERERLALLRNIVLNDAEIRRMLEPAPQWLH